MNDRNDQPILYLAEGDAETWNSWSGCSRSVVHALRRAGRQVHTADVSVAGLGDLSAKALAFSASRQRWISRYHSGAFGFRLRSGHARKLLAAAGDGVPMIQAGATFDCRRDPGQQRYVFCDANAAFSARGGHYGPFDGLTLDEIKSVIARERAIYSRATGIFTFTEGLRQSFIDDFDVDPDHVVTTHVGPNLERFPDESDLATPKSEVPTILFIGKQFERKGGPTLVRALRYVREAVPTARLLIVGCRPDLPDIPGVEVLGFVPRDVAGPRGLQHLFLTSHVFCMPSRFEPFGTVFPESMAHGLPCIGPRTYASEIIDDGTTGWLVDATSVQDLAAALIRTLSDLDRARAMGLAGRERMLRMFSWDRVAALMIDYMERVGQA